MAVTSFGTPAMTRATSGSVTATWGTGQNRTAGHLLVAMVSAGGSTASAAAISTPAGWTQQYVISNTATTANAWVAVYTKIAAGSDSAPAFTATLSGTVAMTCTLFELAAADYWTPVDTYGEYASGGSAATLSAITVATAGQLSVAGEYAITCYCQEAAAATNTWNGPGGSWANAANDGATSSVLHTAVDYQANPSAGAILSETGNWTTNASAYGAALIVVFAPQASGIELFTNDASTTISSGGTTAPASGTPEVWTAGSWSSFPTASPTISPRTTFHVSDPALPSELIEVVNTATGQVIRGAEGTTPVAHSAGFTVQNVMTAGSAAGFPPTLNARSVQFGAKGDGVTDDTAALQAMLTAAGKMAAGLTAAMALNGVPQYRAAITAQIPPGLYVVTPPSATVPALTVPSNVIIDGLGGAVLLKNGNGILLDFSGAGPTSQNGKVNESQGLRNIVLNGGSHTGLLMRLYYMQDFLEEHVLLTNNADVSVDTAQLWDSRFNNGLYLYGGSTSASAVSGGQAVTHLIRNSAAPATTLSAGISGTITALPVAALPAALPAGVVQVWNAAGQVQNFTTTGAASAATSIPVTSATVAYPFVSGNAVNGFGWSGDNCNALIFSESHWEDNYSGAIWLTQGINNASNLNFIFFEAMKCEQDQIGYNCPQIQVDSGDGVYFRGVEAYAGGFYGGYSTAVPFMQFNPNFGAVTDFVLANGASPCLSTGITVNAGFDAGLFNTYSYWATAPTSGNATEITGGYAFLVQHQANGTFTTAIATSGGGVYTLLGDQNSAITIFTGTVLDDGAGNMSPAGMLKLAAGTASLTPLKFQSGTNLTSATAGDMEYDGVSTYITNETTSGRGLNLVEQKFRLTSTGSTISTIANYFGSTSNISLVSGGEYEIEIDCWFLRSTTDPVVWTFTNSAAPTSMNLEYKFSATGGIVSTAAATSLFGDQYNITTATATVTTGSLTTAVNHHHKFWIRLINGTGTSLKIQATASTGGTITPGINSSWKARRVPAANVGTFSA